MTPRTCSCTFCTSSAVGPYPSGAECRSKSRTARRPQTPAGFNSTDRKRSRRGMWKGWRGNRTLSRCVRVHVRQAEGQDSVLCISRRNQPKSSFPTPGKPGQDAVLSITSRRHGRVSYVNATSAGYTHGGVKVRS